MAGLRFVPLLAALSALLAASSTVPVNTVTYDTRACQAPYNTYPFCNTTLSLDERIADLISRLEPSDIPPMLTARHGGRNGPTDNVSAIGLPEYDWGMNAIHGVQSTCVSVGNTTYCPTSFPNPVNFGMTWNSSLFYSLGAVIGVETRALWVAGACEQGGTLHIGLDAWSPNININRDPRWGRNVEVASEDPLVNGLFGQLYTQGIQFNDNVDPNYLQAIVTLKHWDAYSLETSDNFTRYDFNAIVSNYGLADTFFPAFKRSVVEGGALGIMCSYNAVNGIPTCANPFLAHVLRDVWGFQGYQTSDSGALENIYGAHHYVDTVEEAACVAIRNGATDVCSGSTYNAGLLNAVSSGLCGQADVTKALTNIFRLRFRLGLFDPAENQPFWHVPPDVINTPASQSLNWLTTLTSLVLLKNDNATLPFPKGKTVAVIGPHALSQGDLVGNYLGQLCPDNTYDCIPSPFAAISAANVGGVTNTAYGCNITSNSTDGYAAAVALAKASDYVVLMLGIDLHIEAESHDRTSIDLPPVQHGLVAAIVAGAGAGKPIAIVLINGGMVDITPEKASVGAIIEAGYPGMLGGTAIAATVFGDNDRLGGKLPYTIYPADYINQIAMSEMEMDVGPGRSYRYYNGTTVYPFGWGLSYTSFSLSVVSGPGPSVSQSTTCSPSSNLTFTLSVQNTGSVTGDEVVFGFFVPSGLTSQPTNRLIKQLFGFERVHLAAGEIATVSFTVSASTLQLVDKATGDIVSTPGSYDIVFTNGVQNSVLGSTVSLKGDEVVCVPFPAL